MMTRFKFWNRLQWKRKRKKWALGGSRGGRVKKKLKVGKDKSVIKGGQRPQEDDNGDAWVRVHRFRRVQTGRGYLHQVGMCWHAFGGHIKVQIQINKSIGIGDIYPPRYRYPILFKKPDTDTDSHFIFSADTNTDTDTQFSFCADTRYRYQKKHRYYRYRYRYRYYRRISNNY